MDPMSWIDEVEKVKEEEYEKGYFKIVEGDNRVQILTHCPPLAQVYEPSTKTYRAAVEGEKGASIKGVCWLLQDGVIKQAKLPYTVIKAIRAYQLDEETAFDSFPMPYAINIKAKGAGTKEVEYTVIASRKETPVSAELLKELKSKPTPEQIIEKIKGKKEVKEEAREGNYDYKKAAYGPDAPDPDDVPF